MRITWRVDSYEHTKQFEVRRSRFEVPDRTTKKPRATFTSTNVKTTFRQPRTWNFELQTYLRQIKIKHNLIHTIKMSFWTFSKSRSRTRTTRDFIIFQHCELGTVGIPAK